ncbi:hypothetical protein [Dickeya dadantii]|uniref:hypothetical protein n=1 Tax=Dickeya dadantii TaxID=204038 RepID=UPI0020A650C5|nr:hypothetical protein [Dickeya dadantii]
MSTNISNEKLKDIAESKVGTVGQISIVSRGMARELLQLRQAAKEPVGNDKAWHICNNCDDEVSGHRRVDLFVAPDGRWLCENCADDECHDGKLPDNWRKTLPHPSELFTAPPLPVVPDERVWRQVGGRDDFKFTEGWNACRAAMIENMAYQRANGNVHYVDAAIQQIESELVSSPAPATQLSGNSEQLPDEPKSKGTEKNSNNQPGVIVAVHIDAGDFVKVKGQVFEVAETDFDDHDVTLWFVGGNSLKCAAGCPIEVVQNPSAPEQEPLASVPEKCPGVPAWVFADNVDPRQCYAAGWKAHAVAAGNSPVIPEGLRSVITADDVAALRRFEACCDDPESGGHDLDKEQVKRLEEVGALRRAGRIHFITGFGSAVLASPQHAQFRGVTDLISEAVRGVIAERERQITDEGWTPEHDDEHVGFEMSFAAATYAMHVAQSYGGQPYKHIAPSEIWPWDLKWLKFAPGPRRSLIKAAALILAEIERLDRAAPQSEGGDNGAL